MPVIQESISLFHSLLQSECHIPPKSPSLTLLGAEIRSPHTVFWEYREGLEYLFTARRVQRKKKTLGCTYIYIHKLSRPESERKKKPPSMTSPVITIAITTPINTEKKKAKAHSK